MSTFRNVFINIPTNKKKENYILVIDIIVLFYLSCETISLVYIVFYLFQYMLLGFLCFGLSWCGLSIFYNYL